jgi:hypothetical protein
MHRPTPNSLTIPTTLSRPRTTRKLTRTSKKNKKPRTTKKNNNNNNNNDNNDNDNDNNAPNNQDVPDEKFVINITNIKPLTAKWKSLDKVSKKLMPFVEGDRIKIEKLIQEALKIVQKQDSKPDLDGWTKTFAGAYNVGGRSKKKTIKHLGVMLASSDPNELPSSNLMGRNWFKARAPSPKHCQELVPSTDPDGFPRSP